MSQRNRITIGRVKGSMIYTGVNPESVQNPLNNDLYFHTQEYKFYCYNNGSWNEVTDLKEHVINALNEELEDKEVLKNIKANQLEITAINNHITESDATFSNKIKTLENVKANKSYVDETVLKRIVEDEILISANSQNIDRLIDVKVDAEELTKNYYKKSVIDNMITSLTRLTIRKIYSLPEVGEPNVLYLLADPSGKQKECKEYLYVDNQWELIGSTEVDLNGYVQDQDVTIQNETATSKTVGGISAGTVLKGKTVLEVLEDILYPYVSFSVSISGVSPSPSPYEKGTSATIKGITVKITPGSKPVSNIKLYESDKTTLLGEKTSDISTSNTFSVNKTVTDTVSFYVEASDGAKTLNATASFLSFYYPTFYGVLNEGYILNNDSITSGQKSLKSSKSNTYTFTATNQHPFVAYPASYGNISSIKDSSNLEYIGDFIKTTMDLTVTGGTISYNVYVLKNPTDITNYKFIFS